MDSFNFLFDHPMKPVDLARKYRRGKGRQLIISGLTTRRQRYF